MNYTRIWRNIGYMSLAGLIFMAGVSVSSLFKVPEIVSAAATEDAGSAVISGREYHSGLPSFADVVRKEKPAVVNISTTRVVQDRRFGGNQSNPYDPFRDFFGDDFFDRFFRQMPRREYKTQSLGSGFIIDKEGFILTNNHVIENADEIIVKLTDEREFKARLVGRDAKTDVALIKIEDHGELPVVHIGDSDNLEVGEWVIAIGNPFGVGQTVTAGIVSAKGRDIGAGPYDDFIQTDASINPGNSGGPLFNARGEVVGVNSAIYSPSGGNVGIGFAIPINMVKRLLPQIKEKGSVTRGWLGVVIQPVTRDLAKTFDLASEEGALVADVANNSPAEKAGIKRGDVVTEFGGEKIGKMKDLPTIVAATPVGSKVKVKILRDGKEKVLTAKIDKLEDEEGVVAGSGDTKDLGMSVQEITPEIARQLDLKTTGGVLITMIERGSPADQGDLAKGDVLLQVNRQDIGGIGDYKKEIKKLKKGDTALFLIARGPNTFYATIKIEK